MAKSKKEAERKHSKRRAYERYNFELTKEMRSRIIGIIRNQKASFLGRTSRNRTIWMVELDRKFFKVVYDKKRHELVTFLPYPGHEIQSTYVNEM